MKPFFTFTALLFASLNNFGHSKSQNLDTLIVFANKNVIIKTEVSNRVL